VSDDDYVFAEVDRSYCVACQHTMGETVSCEVCHEQYCQEHLTETEKGWMCSECEEEEFGPLDAQGYYPDPNQEARDAMRE
jgi:hypothetical protein